MNNLVDHQGPLNPEILVWGEVSHEYYDRVQTSNLLIL